MPDSPYQSFNLEHRRQALFMLEKLLPLARKAAVNEPTKIEIHNPLAALSFAHWKLSNVFGVHIYQTPGGWLADVIFKDVPTGVSPIIGTPLASPLATRFLAEENAVQMLALIIMTDEKRVDVETLFNEEPVNQVIFDLDGEFHYHPREVIDSIAESMEDDPLREAVGHLALKELLKMIEEDFPNSAVDTGRITKARLLEYYRDMMLALASNAGNRVRRGAKPHA